LVGVDPKQAPEAVDGFSMARKRRFHHESHREHKKESERLKVAAKKRKSGSK